MAKLSIQLKQAIRHTQRQLDSLQTLLAGVEQAELRIVRKRIAGFPRIERDRWLSAIDSTSQPLGKIVDKVMHRLNIDPSDRRRVTQRCVVFMSAAIKAGDVVKEGSLGRYVYKRPDAPPKRRSSKSDGAR